MTTAITGHQLWFREAHQIISLCKHSILPIPSLNAARASFSFVTVTHGEDARDMVETAERVLARELELAVTFFTHWHECGSARHRIRTAVLPSGMQVDLVAHARHFADEDAELRAVAA